MTIQEIIIDARFDEILYQVENLSDADLMTLNNEYCEAHNYADDTIYYNDADFFQVFYGDDVMQALEDAEGTDFSIREEYVKHTIWGLKSSDYVSDLVDVDNEELADYLIEHQDTFRYFHDVDIDWDDVDYEIDKALWEALDDLCQDYRLDTDTLVEYAKEHEIEDPEVEDLILMYLEEEND